MLYEQGFQLRMVQRSLKALKFKQNVWKFPFNIDVDIDPGVGKGLTKHKPS